MIDLHCHVLAGIDDGPEDSAGSLALAREACAAGIRTIVATPHVSWRYDNRAATIAPLVAALNEELRAERIAVEVLAGAEVALTRAIELEPRELQALHLGGGPWLLLEVPTTPVAVGLEEMVASIQAQGHRILLAHPERCAPFHREPQLLASLVRAGALVSVTAGSLVGDFGGPVRRFALRLVRDGLVHNVVSDAHDAVGRPPQIGAALRQAGLEALAEWWTEEVPAAILSGHEIPPRPRVDMAAAADQADWRPRAKGLLKALGR